MLHLDFASRAQALPSEWSGLNGRGRGLADERSQQRVARSVRESKHCQLLSLVGNPCELALVHSLQAVSLLRLRAFRRGGGVEKGELTVQQTIRWGEEGEEGREGGRMGSAGGRGGWATWGKGLVSEIADSSSSYHHRALPTNSHFLSGCRLITVVLT